jgi:hypothetical protein
MEYLGLHNKLIAAVSPELLVTGRLEEEVIQHVKIHF